MSQIVSVSPHCHGKITTQSIMRDVLIALAPALVAGVINFGWRALLVTAVCAAACMFFEWGFEKLCGKPSTISDLSAAVSGVSSVGRASSSFQNVCRSTMCITPFL